MTRIALIALIALATATQGKAARCLACGSEYNGINPNGTVAGTAAKVQALQLPGSITPRG